MIDVNKIEKILTSNKINYCIQGDKISVSNCCAFEDDLNNAVCYYTGSDLSNFNIANSIVFCSPQGSKIQNGTNTYIFTENPQFCFYLISKLFEPKKKRTINKSAKIDTKCTIGVNVKIEAFAVIENCSIGNNVVIESGVKIYEGSIIGNNVHIQSNTVIGASGVMWVGDDHGKRIRCAQRGIVIVEDNVFIGSNITIVKGAFHNRPTVIGEGTMMAHGTMIGHGVIVGKNNHFANNVSIAGSVTTGNYCFFGSASCVTPHVKVPNNTVLGAGSVLTKSFLEPDMVMVGSPAKILKSSQGKLSGVPFIR